MLLLLRAYGLHMGAVSGGIGGIALFMGYFDDMNHWFTENRQVMVGVLVVHAAIFAIWYCMRQDERKSRALIGQTEKSDE